MSEINQLEEIKKLYAKPKSYKVPSKPKDGQVQANIKIMPIGLDELVLMDMKKGAPLSETAKTMKKLFSVSLGITIEEAGKLSFSFMEDLLEAVMDANNFSKEDINKTGIKEFLTKKREQTKAQEVQEQKKDEPAGEIKE